ncbi:MAG: hypothetical protein Tsb005_18740 [Gammaproteobacteria bacterium]
MNNSSILIKIINKLNKLIKNFDDLTSEEIRQKIQIILSYVEQLTIKEESFIERMKAILEETYTSIIYILSKESLNQLKKLLNEIHAFFNGYEIFTSILETGYIDQQLIRESYEPWIDTDSGEVTYEINSHVKDAIYPLLLNSEYVDAIEPSKFSSDCESIFTNSINSISDCFKLYLSNLRQKLSDEIEGFINKKAAQHKDMHRQHRSSQLFFNPEKNTDPDAKKIADTMYQNRTIVRNYKEPSISITNISSRHVITAAYSAIKRISALDNPPLPSYESVRIGETVVTWQNRLSSNNQGNLFIMGLGRYGTFNSKGTYDSNAILSLINQATEYVGEAQLAELMIKFSSSGEVLCLADLDLKDTQKNQKFIDKLNKFLLLTSCAEIWRYMHTSVNQDGLRGKSDIIKIEQIAFANAHARVLQLLVEGELSMKQVFDEDADFGLPTGSKITKNVPKIIQKFLRINELFNEKIVINYNQSVKSFLERFPTAGIASFRSSHLYELQYTYDSAYQVEIDEDDSSDEETNSYRYS